MDERTELISLRAYEIWERLGRPNGGHMAHWLEAERQIDAATTGGQTPDVDAGGTKKPTAA